MYSFRRTFSPAIHSSWLIHRLNYYFFDVHVVWFWMRPKTIMELELWIQFRQKDFKFSQKFYLVFFPKNDENKRFCLSSNMKFLLKYAKVFSCKR